MHQLTYDLKETCEAQWRLSWVIIQKIQGSLLFWGISQYFNIQYNEYRNGLYGCGIMLLMKTTVSNIMSMLIKVSLYKKDK